VDAGTLWDRYATGPSLRVTPGMGVQLVTPLGPMRLDVGYNGYARQSGTLYLDRQNNLIKIRDNYVPGGNPDRFVVHFAIGQPF
jgi:outer membrane protein assembly factor BamA